MPFFNIITTGITIVLVIVVFANVKKRCILSPSILLWHLLYWHCWWSKLWRKCTEWLLRESIATAIIYQHFYSTSIAAASFMTAKGMLIRMGNYALSLHWTGWKPRWG